MGYIKTTGYPSNIRCAKRDSKYLQECFNKNEQWLAYTQT